MPTSERAPRTERSESIIVPHESIAVQFRLRIGGHSRDFYNPDYSVKLNSFPNLETVLSPPDTHKSIHFQGGLYQDLGDVSVYEREKWWGESHPGKTDREMMEMWVEDIVKKFEGARDHLESDEGKEDREFFKRLGTVAEFDFDPTKFSADTARAFYKRYFTAGSQIGLLTSDILQAEGLLGSSTPDDKDITRAKKLRGTIGWIMATMGEKSKDAGLHAIDSEILALKPPSDLRDQLSRQTNGKEAVNNFEDDPEARELLSFIYGTLNRLRPMDSDKDKAPQEQETKDPTPTPEDDPSLFESRVDIADRLQKLVEGTGDVNTLDELREKVENGDLHLEDLPPVLQAALNLPDYMPADSPMGEKWAKSYERLITSGNISDVKPEQQKWLVVQAAGALYTIDEILPDQEKGTYTIKVSKDETLHSSEPDKSLRNHLNQIVKRSGQAEDFETLRARVKDDPDYLDKIDDPFIRALVTYAGDTPVDSKEGYDFVKSIAHPWEGEVIEGITSDTLKKWIDENIGEGFKVDWEKDKTDDTKYNGTVYPETNEEPTVAIDQSDRREGRGFDLSVLLERAGKAGLEPQESYVNDEADGGWVVIATESGKRYKIPISKDDDGDVIKEKLDQIKRVEQGVGSAEDIEDVEKMKVSHPEKGETPIGRVQRWGGRIREALTQGRNGDSREESSDSSMTDTVHVQTGRNGMPADTPLPAPPGRVGRKSDD